MSELSEYIVLYISTHATRVSTVRSETVPGRRMSTRLHRWHGRSQYTTILCTTIGASTSTSTRTRTSTSNSADLNRWPASGWKRDGPHEFGGSGREQVGDKLTRAPKRCRGWEGLLVRLPCSPGKSACQDASRLPWSGDNWLRCRNEVTRNEVLDVSHKITQLSPLL